MDYVQFVTPYSRQDKARRLLWSIAWLLLARPFPKSVASSWKRFLLRLFGAKMADTAIVYSSAMIVKPWNLEMKDYACIANGVDCYNAAKVTVGVNATVSQRAYLCTASHDITDPHHRQLQAPITIKDRAWVAAEAFIGPGVTVGEGAVVGARATVFRNVESWTVVGGSPARFIKMRTFKNINGGGNTLKLHFAVSLERREAA